MSFNEIWYKIKKGTKRFFRKAKRLIKRYIRLLVRHTKARDYSILIYSVLALVVLILFFYLIGHAFSGKKKKKTEKTTTEVQIQTPTEATEDPAVTARRETEEKARAIYDAAGGLMVLVNPTHPLASDYSFTHKTLNAGYDIDERMYDQLIALSDAINAAGFEYNILGGYRDRETQQSLLDSQIENLIAEGVSEEEARNQAKLNIDEPGMSEHETGLAIDIVSSEVTTRSNFDDTAPATQWLMENSYKYGFILRFPADKTGVTGVNYKPWHFRYVGVEAASFLHENNLTLEEFYTMIGE